MTKVRLNILANYVGSFWQMAMALLFIPLYVKFVGIESYGITGFLGSLESVIYLLDMGLSTKCLHGFFDFSKFGRISPTLRCGTNLCIPSIRLPSILHGISRPR